MQNVTTKLPLDELDLGHVQSATFKSEAGELYTYAPDMTSSEFATAFPHHRRLVSLLDSSGSSWNSHTYVFYVEDCFDPPLYLQVGSSFTDAYDSYIDNDASLLIEQENFKDYSVDSDPPTYGFTSAGAPVDTEDVKGFQVWLKSVTFQDKE